MRCLLSIGLLVLSCLLPFGDKEAFARSNNSTAEGGYREKIDLGGEWWFALDRDSTGASKGYSVLKLGDKVVLPGTTDTNGKGDALADDTIVTTHLSRRYSYVGKAWYQRDVSIPNKWKGKHITLFLERTKPTTVYVDGKKIGSCDDVSVPHVYDLSDHLSPGDHTLFIMVDNGNSVPEQLLGSSHAYTEDTQTNWNGIIGELYLEASNADLRFISLRTQPSADLLSVETEMTLSGSIPANTIVRVTAAPRDGSASQCVDTIVDTSTAIVNDDGSTTLRLSIPLSSDAPKWNEFHPSIFTLTATAEGYDQMTSTFGLRHFEAVGNHFCINGRQTFLRGKHDACVFPFTAHVPMDYQSWYRHLSICKEYGINHLRFHSWCPPEACFQAADDIGVYLQPELPIWGGMDADDQRLLSFLKDEGLKILARYGNHPSFVMMALGNELWGSADVMADFLAAFREADNLKAGDNTAFPKGGRRLFTYGTCVFLGYQGYFQPMDYFTTCRMGGEAYGEYNTHVRGSYAFCDAYDGGIINHEYPNTTTNFEQAIGEESIPIISHETGQFQTYPDYAQISKYTGVLKPCNLTVFRNRLQQAGMLSQAERFHEASGHWAVELYKADMEMDLRTSNMAGFHLLDLQDYPGQGSAYVGILDAFMEKKGIDGKGLVEPEVWRQWCAPVVVLAELPRFTYTDGDTITWRTLIANYAESDGALEGKRLSWRVIGADGRTLSNGDYALRDIHSGVNAFHYQQCIARLASSDKAEQLRLDISVDSTDYRNSYPLWLYPNVDFTSEKAALSEGIIIADTLTDVLLSKLEQGEKVLLMPRHDMYQALTVGGLVQTDYWNYRMFKTISENNGKPVSPGTLGLLVNDTIHPLMSLIPSQPRSTWQWAPIAHAARPLVMDIMPEGYEPLVQVIDNVERNHRLGLIFEFSVGEGRLLVCMSDLNQTAQYPEARHLLLSMLRYMHSDGFQPQTSCSADTLLRLFTTVAGAANLDELQNISYH